MLQKKVLACIVSYENADRLGNVLNSLTQQESPQTFLKVVVTDNSDSDEGRRKCHSIAIQFGAEYVSLENQGVSGGYAAAAAMAHKEAFDYLWLWDQDSSPTPNILAHLVAGFEIAEQSRDRVGVVAPKLRDRTGKDQHWVFYGPPYKLHMMASMRFPMEKIETGLVETTYFVNSGALLNLKMVQELGPPTVDFFMDFVDFEYSSRIVSAGYQLFIQASAIVEHQVGTPEPHRLLNRTIWARNYRPFRYYYQAKNDILLAYRSRAALSLFLPVFVRLAIRPLKLAYDRELFWVKCAAHICGIWDGILNRKGKTHRSWMM